MISILENKNNKWLLTLIEQEDDLKKIRRYRSRDSINAFVDELNSPEIIVEYINDVKLYYDDNILVLKNYRKYRDRVLYKKISRKVNNDVKIVNVLYTNIEKIRSIVKKVLINKITVASTIVVLGTSIVSALKPSSLQPSNPVEETTEHSENENPTELETSIDEMLNDENNIINKNQQSFNSLDDRILQLEDISSTNQNGNFAVGSKLNEYTLNKMVSYMKEHEQTFKNASLKYGIDPYLLLSFCMTETSLMHDETIPGGTNYNGCAIGAMQIESINLGSDITAYNYQTNQYDTVSITQDKLTDLSSNIEIGAMIFQNILNRYNNNVYISIQAYNYGVTAMDKVIQAYAKQTGKEFEEVISDVNDIGWMKYVNDIHKNPKKYLPNWEYNTYGNNTYVYSVLGYYIGRYIVINDNCVYDLVFNTCTLYSEDPLYKFQDSSKSLSQEDTQRLSR